MGKNFLHIETAFRAVTLILILCGVGISKSYAYDFSAVCSTGQTLYYNITDHTNYYVTLTYPGSSPAYPWSGFAKPTGVIVIPEIVEYNGIYYSVTSIQNDTFYGCSGLTSLAIGNSVESIGSDAFSACSGLTSLTMPNSVTSIGNSAFSWCSGLTSVNYLGDIAQWCNITFASSGSNPLEYAHNLYINNALVTDLIIPETVTEVKKYAFYGCSGLTSITIPNSVTSIGYAAFSGCSGLTSLTIPNSVTNITDFAFSGCSGITSLTIPNSLTSIAGHGFSDCSGLTSITIPNSVTNIGYCAFYGCSGLTSLTIPNSVTNIAGNAFYNCSGLMSLIIGNSVESIGDYAFRGCSGLTSVTIPNSVTSIGSDAFCYCSGITTVYWNAVNMISYPSSAYNTNGAFRYCYNLTEVVFGDSVLTIPSYAFYDCSGLTSLTIGNSVDIIGDYAFSRCSGLTSLTIPTSVTSIGNSAFYGCSGLSSVNYTGDIAQWCSVTFGNAGSNPLYYAHNLQINNTLVTNLIIPEIVTEVKQYAFYSCSGLTSLIIGNSVTSIEECAFHSCSGLTSLIIGNSVESIGDYAFLGCSGLTSLTIPNSVTSIGVSAFRNCIGLASLTMGNSLTNIGDNAFNGCSGLISLTLGNSVVNIGDYAFYNCNGLASLIIPNSVTNIGWAAFYGCSELTSLTIGNSVGSVAGHAFSGCGGLTSINILAVTPPTINNYTFYNVSKTIPVNIPCGTLDAYQSAQYWSEFTNYQEDCPNIVFTDYHVKALCVANWDTNGDGELSYAEAAVVTDLGDVFAHNYYIVTFDELQYFTGLTTIGNSAFAWCHGLTSVVLPSTITEIGNQAFYDCRNLLSITIPAAVSSIDSSALSCENMETIVVEEGNTVYDSRDNCNAIIITSSNELLRGCKNTVIPNTVISLGVNAFASCAIESISIPASVVSISNTTFYACENIETITVDANNIVYDSRNNCNAIIETSTNQLVAGSKTTVIPNTVTSIGEKAFSYRFRWGSYEITIPESVTSIGASAYLGGYGIVSFSVLAEVPPTLGNNVFEYVYKDIPVYVPCGTRNAYLAADGWSEFTNIIVDPECGRQITASVNPANTGSVTGAGSYDVGDICTLRATPESGYRFVNWTENNEVVSTNATYQFTVNANRDLVANFEEYVLTNHYVCDISQFADYMPVVAVVVIDGVEQGSETLEIGAFSGDECRGSKFAAYFTPTQHYIYQLPVYGEGGDAITFKLYNHDIQQELDITCTVELQWQKSGYGGLSNPYEITFVSSVNISATVNPANAGTITGSGTYMPGETATLAATANGGYAFANWTEGGNVVSQNATYSFTVTTARELVANFNTVQTNTLSAGWNWYSTYIEQTGIDGLSMLEEGLGEHGELIMSRTGAMVENFEGSFWWGDLNAVTNEEMYEIKTNAQTNVVLTGGKAMPSSHPITVAPGWNWIGYVSNTSNSIDNALSSLASNEDDIIQSRNAFSSYFPGYGWYGDLENMTPGQGYMYKSNGTVSQTLVYPTASRSNESEAIVYKNQADYNRYRNVMDVMAKVIINGEPANSNRYELAAFVDGECRGRAKLQYVEPIETYLAFITINGNDDETVTFNLYDEDMDVTYYASESNVVAFKANEVVGKFRSPYILCFNNAENVENTVFTVYPNPAANGDEITINFMEDVTEATLFVENELGLTVDVVKLSGKSAKVRFDLPSGLYILRVVIDGNIYYNKLIVK